MVITGLLEAFQEAEARHSEPALQIWTNSHGYAASAPILQTRKWNRLTGMFMKILNSRTSN